jgi:class 3 adenylate cyclase
MSDQLRKYTGWLFGRTLFSQAVVAPESLKLQAQERSILFADLRGFVEWSEHRTPEEVVTMLNRYFEAAETILAPSSVIKTEYTGDEIMAVFAGATEAAQVALALQRSIHEVLAPLGLSAGMGIHSGPVIEGLVGGPDVKEYCFVGDSVNTANRICKQAAGGQILVSRSMTPQLGAGTVYGPGILLQIKGKTAQLEVLPLQAL